MSTTFDARDDDGQSPPSANVALADEEALYRVFLTEFSALNAEAREDLGADALALAPKVVEGSFVRAWDARSRFQTPQEVHAFLVEDVHHASARALSRRAGARRLAGHEHGTAHALVEPTPEEAWKHIMQALHGESHSPKALADLAAASRHGAAEHITEMARKDASWMPMIIGAAALALVVAMAAWMTHLNRDTKFAQALNAPDVRVVSSRQAQIAVVTLDDGTKVRLSPESKITLPKAFGAEMRVVRLEGTAAFEVAPGQATEFQVYANKLAVVAKGTSFTVRANPGDSAITVVVTEGSVQVGDKKQMEDVAAGSALVSSPASSRPASAIERDEADAWRTGTLAVANRPLGEVLALMRRWYGVNIMVEKPALLERRATFSASLDSTRHAIRGVEESAGLQFGYIGQNMAFRDTAATKVAAPKAKTAAPKKR